MSGPKEPERISPPYVPWKTFLGLLELLKQIVIPQRIDRSVMDKKFSGGTITAMLSGLRFLGLIAADGTTTPALRELISASGDPVKWKLTLRDIVANAYYRIIGDDLDLDTGSASQLIERFREVTKLDGDTLRKSVAFYLQAQMSAGVTMSPYFNTRSLRTPSPSKPKAKLPAPVPAKGNGNGVHDERKTLPKGIVRLPLPLPRGECAVEVPDDVTIAEWGLVDSYMRMWIGLR